MPRLRGATSAHGIGTASPSLLLAVLAPVSQIALGPVVLPDEAEAPKQHRHPTDHAYARLRSRWPYLRPCLRPGRTCRHRPAGRARPDGRYLAPVRADESGAEMARAIAGHLS